MSYQLWRPYERNMIILLYNILSGFRNYFIVIYWSIQQYYIMPVMGVFLSPLPTYIRV